MSSVENKLKALKIAIEITTAYAGSANHNVGGIASILDDTYHKLVELSDDASKSENK